MHILKYALKFQKITKNIKSIIYLFLNLDWKTDKDLEHIEE